MILICFDRYITEEALTKCFMADFIVFGNVLSLCAFLGAVRCSESVLSECREVDNDIVSVAVRGGNLETFQMLCEIGIDITKCRSDSIFQCYLGRESHYVRSF
jgi:hypothetical protein